MPENVHFLDEERDPGSNRSVVVLVSKSELVSNTDLDQDYTTAISWGTALWEKRLSSRRLTCSRDAAKTW